MPLLTIKTSNEYVPVGTYKGTFQGLEEVTNDHGNAWRWVFQLDDGRTLTGISDRDKPPTPKNKTGRWLSALSKKPLSDGVSVDTDAFVGKTYLLIVADNGNERTKLDTFSATW